MRPGIQRAGTNSVEARTERAGVHVHAGMLRSPRRGGRYYASYCFYGEQMYRRVKPLL